MKHTDELPGKYEVEDSTENALEMIGAGYEPSIEVEPERTIIERRGGEFKEVVKPAFVKISTSFKSELVTMSDAAFKVWAFIALSVNRTNGKAHPGLRTIARALGKGVNTVQDCLKELEALNLMTVDRNSRKYNIYEPVGYVSANRIDPVSEPDTDAETVSKNLETVSEKPQTVSNSQILNQRNQKEPEDTFFEWEKELANHKEQAWQGREIFRPDHYPLVDWYHSATGQDCPKSKQKDWHKAVQMWVANNLTPTDLQAAYDMDITWRKVFTSPNQLTDKAIALRAQKQSQPQQEYTRLL